MTPLTLLAGPAAAPTTGSLIAFIALGAIVIGGALATITSRNAVTAAMALVASFFGLAGLYLLLDAPFLAALQILVYAGAIMTLFVFVIMVLNREEADPFAWRRAILWKLFGIGGVAYALFETMKFLFKEVAVKPGAPAAGFGGLEQVGELLFTRYLFPFEALSLMLLVAVIGAVVVARTPKKMLPGDGHAGGLAQHRIDDEAAHAHDAHHEAH